MKATRKKSRCTAAVPFRHSSCGLCSRGSHTSHRQTPDCRWAIEAADGRQRRHWCQRWLLRICAAPVLSLLGHLAAAAAEGLVAVAACKALPAEATASAVVAAAAFWGHGCSSNI
eukprot:NODE_21554_length_747_cov_6.725806.p2 GENE.NODE_21554_length_747_cov_6.725806~~NODE_21554_length_747_cov_6.725806.p2  ORF type:complete len:115 (+),score=20.72 NODE_21554_length_747_cov_6.725806:88-432(+)